MCDCALGALAVIRDGVHWHSKKERKKSSWFEMVVWKKEEVVCDCTLGALAVICDDGAWERRAGGVRWGLGIQRRKERGVGGGYD